MRQDKTDTVDFKFVLCAITLLLVTGTVDAQKMYKVVGDDGSVSYQDKPPETDGASVEERHINSNNSSLSLSPPKAPQTPTPAAAQPPGTLAKPVVLGEQPSAAQNPPPSANQNTPQPAPPEQGQAGAPAPAQGEELGLPAQLTNRVQVETRNRKETEIPQTPPADPDGQPSPQNRAKAERNATDNEQKPAITILQSEDTDGTPQRLNAGAKSRNSRGRRPAPAKEQAREKRLTTEELAEIARSLDKD